MGKADMAERDDRNEPVFTMGIAAKLVGTTVQTLRFYEKHGFVHPVRKRRNRLYTANDIRRLRCIRELVHIRKFSIEAIKKLFDYAPCWKIKGCSDEMRAGCSRAGDADNSCSRSKAVDIRPAISHLGSS